MLIDVFSKRFVVSKIRDQGYLAFFARILIMSNLKARLMMSKIFLVVLSNKIMMISWLSFVLGFVLEFLKRRSDEILLKKVTF